MTREPHRVPPSTLFSSYVHALLVFPRPLLYFHAPFVFPRPQVDVAKSLPPKRETLLYVGMSAMQRELYKSLLLRDVEAVLAGGTGGGGGAVSSGRLSNILMQLRKACGHPYLFDGWEDRSLDPMGEHVVDNCAKLKARGWGCV